MRALLRRWASTSSPRGLRSPSASCSRGWSPATRSPAPSRGPQSSGICNAYCIKAIEAQLGFNVHTSIWTQYVQYLGNLVHGNLGFSWSENASGDAA